MSLRVLVVDDDAEFLAMVFEMIRRLECEPFTVNRGFDALNLMGTYRPDLVLTDINMPDMDGEELVSRIRANIVAQRDRAVLIAVTASERDFRYFVSKGFDDLLKKPFRFNDLAVLLGKYKKMLLSETKEIPALQFEKNKEIISDKDG